MEVKEYSMKQHAFNAKKKPGMLNDVSNLNNWRISLKSK
jgi:hypothetical protein